MKDLRILLLFPRRNQLAKYLDLRIMNCMHGCGNVATDKIRKSESKMVIVFDLKNRNGKRYWEETEKRKCEREKNK